jgi:hypothetical protein
MELTRRARDMALEVVNGTAVVEPAVETADGDDRGKVTASDMSPIGEGLSPEDQKMIEQALAGTTGQKPLLRR